MSDAKRSLVGDLGALEAELEAERMRFIEELAGDDARLRLERFLAGWPQYPGEGGAGHQNQA